MNNAFYVEGILGFPSRVKFELIHLNPVAIGTVQSPILQSNCAIAIGESAGLYNQGECAIAIGESAGKTNQGEMAIALGAGAGSRDQSELAIAVGVDAGSENQSTNAVAIGTEAGMTNQSVNAISIGTHAGHYNQGEHSIAIGAYAGQTNQHDRTIILNATGSSLPSTTGTDRTYIAPLRNVSGNTLIQYNTTSNELTANNTINFDLTVNGYVNSLLDLTSPPSFAQNTVSYFGNLGTTSGKYQGGVLVANGKIYNFPYNASNVMIIDPETDTIDTTSLNGFPSGASLFYGGIYHPNGKIYAIPDQAPYVGIIDPRIDTIDISSIKGLTNVSKWNGGCLHPDGKIYCSAYSSSSVLIIDPESAITSISGVDPITSSYVDSTKVLTCPGASFLSSITIGDNILIGTVTSTYTGYVQSIISDTQLVFIYALGLDLSTEQITSIQKTRKADLTSITGLLGDQKWMPGVLAPNSKIYCPFFGDSLGNTTTVMIIDPNSVVTSISGVTPATSSYTNSTKVLNCPGATFTTSLTIGDNLIINTNTTNGQYMGYVQTITNNENVVLIYSLGTDITTGQITSIQKTRRVDITSIAPSPISATGSNYAAGALAPNGKIYMVPYDADNVLVVDPANNTWTVITVSGTNNKYRSATIARNGRIYAIPQNETRVMIIDPVTNTISFITGLPSANSKWIGAVLAPNDCVYGIPFSSSNIVKVFTGIPSIPEWPLEAYFNKL